MFAVLYLVISYCFALVSYTIVISLLIYDFLSLVLILLICNSLLDILTLF